MHPVANLITECAQRIRSSDLPADTQLPLQPPLSPWNIWLLMSLIRQVERQRWVSYVVVSKLGVDMDAMSEAGAFGHPDCPSSGLIPGHTEWEYCLHGTGCCVTNRITGESIDVDFYDGSGDWIDDFFFIHFLKSLRNPEPIERRLIDLYPTIETIQLGIGQLRDEGLLQAHLESKVFKPLNDLQELADDVETINHAMLEDSKREPVATFLGDWLLSPESRAHPTAVRGLQERGRFLESKFTESKTERLALLALCDQVPDATEYLTQALGGPASGTTSAASDIVAGRPDEDWTEPVFGLMCRTDPSGDLPQPHTWTKCAEYLLNRGAHIDEIRAQFTIVGRRSVGDAAILGLEYFPDLALGLFRRALRSDVPRDRITAAAALAILDKPWAHGLLMEILEDTSDQEPTAEARVALMAMPHTNLHDAVLEWEEFNPHEPEPGPFITFREMSLRDRDLRIQHEMEQLHERVIRLRAIVPGELHT